MIKMMDFKLGARVIKTGVSVMLALYVAHWLSLETVVIAAIAAAISVQPSITKMINYLLEQLKANFIGASLALASLYALGNSPLVVGITIIFIILINLKLGYEKTIPMSIVVVIAIMEIKTGSNLETFKFAVERLALILIGICSSFLVNITLVPPEYEASIAKKIRVVNDKVFELVRLLNKKDINSEYVKKEMRKLKKEVERLTHFHNIYHEDKEKNMLRKKFSLLKPIIVDAKMYSLSKSNYKMLKQLIHIHRIGFQSEVVFEKVYELILENIEIQQNIYYLYDEKIKDNSKPNYVEGQREKIYDNLVEVLKDKNISDYEKNEYLILLSMLNNSNNKAEIAQKFVWNVMKQKGKEKK